MIGTVMTAEQFNKLSEKEKYYIVHQLVREDLKINLF